MRSFFGPLKNDSWCVESQAHLPNHGAASTAAAQGAQATAFEPRSQWQGQRADEQYALVFRRALLHHRDFP